MCEIGLMFCKIMFDIVGMLFVFDEFVGYCFWMKNIDLLLFIVFIIDDGIIFDIVEMKLQIEDNYCFIWVGSYVLEMNKGWFVCKGVKFGMKVGGLFC